MRPVRARGKLWPGFLLVGAVSALTGCSPLTALDRIVPEEGYRASLGQAYGPHPRLKLDVYFPEPRREDGARLSASAPVVLFFYGGSWQNGERGLYRLVAQSLTS